MDQWVWFSSHVRRFIVAEAKVQQHQAHGKQKIRLLLMFRGWWAEKEESHWVLFCQCSPLHSLPFWWDTSTWSSEVRVAFRGLHFFLQYIIRKWRRRYKHKSYPRQPDACNLQYKSAWHLAACPDEISFKTKMKSLFKHSAMQQKVCPNVILLNRFRQICLWGEPCFFKWNCNLWDHNCMFFW